MKKIEDWTLYEILDVPRTASPLEVVRGYVLAVSAYGPAAMASYRLMTEDERRRMLLRIEEAYQTLRDPGLRQAYDEAEYPGTAADGALLRKSWEKLDIADAEAGGGLRARLRRLMRRPRRAEVGETPRGGAEVAAVPIDFLSGEHLKGLRIHRHLSLEDGARLLKIGTSALRALEADEYDALPAGLEPGPLLRAYARALGLDLPGRG